MGKPKNPNKRVDTDEQPCAKLNTVVTNTTQGAFRAANNALAGLLHLTYFPHLADFIEVIANVFTTYTTIQERIPPVGPARLQARGLFTGNFMSGHRSTSPATTVAHTAVLLVDPAVEIRDLYRGINKPVDAKPDLVEVDAFILNLVLPYYQVVFSSVSIIPGLGKRRVVLLDQVALALRNRDKPHGISGVLLNGHPTDLNTSILWSVKQGAPTIQNNQIKADVGPATNYAVLESGYADIHATLTVVMPDTTHDVGISLRRSDANNGWDCVFFNSGSPSFGIYEHNAGVYTLRASATFDQTYMTVGSTQSISAKVIGNSAVGTTFTMDIYTTDTNPLHFNGISYALAVGVSGLNQTVTTHGVFVDANQICSDYQAAT